MKHKSVLIFICLVVTNLSPNLGLGQGYEVWLRLTTGWRMDMGHNFSLHPESDYQMYIEQPHNLLADLIEAQYAGEIELYADSSMDKSIPTDSVWEYFYLPPGQYLDSLRDDREIFYAKYLKAWFPDESSQDFDDDFSSFDLDYGDGELPEDKVREPDSLTGREEIAMFRNYHIFLQEKWESIENELLVSSSIMRIDIIRSGDEYQKDEDEYNEGPFPRTKVYHSIYLKKEDWNKIPIGKVFEKKWNTIHGPDLKEIFELRNFPAKISSIRPMGSAEYIFLDKRFGYKARDSLLATFNYEDFCQKKEDVRATRTTQIINPVVLQVQTDLLYADTVQLLSSNHSRLERSKLFFNSSAFKKIWEMRESHEFPTTNYRSWNGGFQNLPLEKYNKALLVSGFLERKDNKTRFKPQQLILLIEKVDTVSNHHRKRYYQHLLYDFEELSSLGLQIEGKGIRDFFSSVDYYFYPVEINETDIENYTQALQLRDLLFSGKWEDIEHPENDYISCDFPISIIPRPFNSYTIYE